VWCDRPCALRVSEAVARCGVTAPVLFALVRSSPGVASVTGHWSRGAAWPSRLRPPGAHKGSGQILC